DHESLKISEATESVQVVAAWAARVDGDPNDAEQRAAVVQERFSKETRVARRSRAVRTECNADRCTLPKRHRLQQCRQGSGVFRLPLESGFHQKLARARHRDDSRRLGAWGDAHPDRFHTLSPRGTTRPSP